MTETTKTFSPVVKEDSEPKGMDFNGAVQAILSGERVARKSWDDGVFYLLVGETMHVKNDKGIHRVVLVRADFEAVDWVVIKNIKE